MLFRDIQGLTAIKNTLINASKVNHVAHAQLFLGNPGSGNLAMTWAYATYLNCTNKLSFEINEQNGLLGDACNQCASCSKMNKNIHPDFYYIFPTATTKKIKEADSSVYMPAWREFLAENPYRTLADWLEHIGVEGNKQGNISVEEARKVMQKIGLKAFEGEFKIMIIWLPEQMNAASSNALLKTLEEPPSKTIFLLAANDANKLLTTILSRTQKISIPAFEDEDIATYITSKQGIDSKRANEIAYLSEGNLAKAIALSQNHSNEYQTWFSEWMRSCFKADLTSLIKQADQFDAFAKENQKAIFEYGLNVFRDLQLWQNGVESLVRLEGDELVFIQNFSKAVNPLAIEIISDKLSEAHYHLERNARAKILHLDLSLAIARCIRKK